MFWKENDEPRCSKDYDGKALTGSRRRANDTPSFLHNSDLQILRESSDETTNPLRCVAMLARVNQLHLGARNTAVGKCLHDSHHFIISAPAPCERNTVSSIAGERVSHCL